MIDSKLIFKIQEIPDGESRRNIDLDSEDLEFEHLKLGQAHVEVNFLKNRYFIKAGFSVEAGVMVICDRSLDEYEQQVRGSYEVIFKPDADEEIDAGSESERSRVKSFNIHDLTLSLEQEVRDTVLLELPVKKLHPRFYDSEGNPRDFETKLFGKVTGGEGDAVDPRWEELRKLK